MIKHFYSYHVEIDSIIIEIEPLPIKDHEKKHLIELAESQVHHAILDSILSELSGEDRKTFLSHINSKNHEKTWKFLNSILKDAEKKITAAANKIKKELLADIKELKLS
jgi:hypothetical protein